MGKVSRAERLLDELAPIQRLITRLKAVRDESITPAGVELSKGTRANIDGFRAYMQGQIDTLTTQQEETLALINRVPDPEAHIILFWRYAAVKGKPMPWMDIAEKVHYEPATLYRYHRRGIDYIDQLLDNNRGT